VNKSLPLSLLLVLAAGCLAPSSNINRVSLGMTKEQVIKAAGNPVSITGQGNVEILNYRLMETWRERRHGTAYFVRLVDGKVQAYGRNGDFGSSPQPSMNLNAGPTLLIPAH